MRKLGTIAMVALMMLTFGPVSHIMAQSKVVRITLIDENGSGEDGSAQLTDLGDGTTKVELIMLNAPDGAQQPAHIHKGTCANLDAAPAFPLETVKDSKSTTIVKVSLADLTKDKYAINVHKSAAEASIYVSCGNLPSAAAVSGQPMTMDQVMTTLLDQANEILGVVKKKEVDASQNAYDAWHTTFAAHENDIKAKSADSQAKLEEAMHGVRDALAAGKFDDAEKAAEELIAEVKAAQTALAGASTTSNTTSAESAADAGLRMAFEELQTLAADLVSETGNKDKDGAQAAYNSFHETFATNEDAIKAKNASAQANIEMAMHDVRDALAVGDFTKASTASKELQDTVKEADNRVMGMADANSSLPQGGNGDTLIAAAALSLIAFILLLSGAAARRRTAL